MGKYLKVIDTSSIVKQNYFKLVFFRGRQVKGKVPLFKWIWLCFVEVLFGEEILESLVTTSSLSGSPEDEDVEGKHGYPQQLNLHIPVGLFTSFFRGQILQVLYYKYYLQYLFIEPLADPLINEAVGAIDVSRVRFRLRKSLLYLVIAFRRVYVLIALLTNFSLNVLVYFVTESFEVAFISALLLEVARRLIKL
ncbi:hypothetical protein [Marinomonas fungiae]|uniref:Uncharacterized protein n=1 Tax=Marinomonas fungiae TaxID=1137284 RepID=A0A0K6IQ25_9GAMM|nr:hypothetical protein [Marinomonas fungiae]CUB05422.1 hypothetical protein Ga0061065_11110 [Marinomonas fungiae]